MKSITLRETGVDSQRLREMRRDRFFISVKEAAKLHAAFKLLAQAAPESYLHRRNIQDAVRGRHFAMGDSPFQFVLEDMAERGRAWIRPRTKVAPGKRGYCHHNAERNRRRDKSYRYVTGFYLTEGDAFWRPHSWNLRKGDSCVHETTGNKALAYVGVLLDRMPKDVYPSGSSGGRVKVKASKRAKAHMRKRA